tara:strand:- start:13128 stop:14606 length:1479 start_codon:yes stop_codon:yes gene_type:complete
VRWKSEDMTLRIYNTLTGKKEEFTPISPPKVGMYVCGVTVYDLCHIGHARSAIVFDVIYRYLRHSGFDVNYIRNFTDIDDKIINRAKELSIEWDEVATKFIDEFNIDMAALGLLKPNIEPKATDHISEMIEMIQSLVDNGKAYEINGSVYFSVKSFPQYGSLSKRNIEELQSGIRIEINDEKQDPLDFALWKASKPGEPAWESPWGSGRPGWHIECSAMSRKYLGITFDIHGGGKDLVFPHHENEIAQSHACSGEAPVNVWLHNGFVNVNAEKMSKSLGNFCTIKDALALYHPEIIRYFVLTSHYRSPVDFTDTALSDARKNLARFYDLLSIENSLVPSESDSIKSDSSMVTKFNELMDDDFNTATTLAYLGSELRKYNKIRAEFERMHQKSERYEKAKHHLKRGVFTLRQLGQTLGLFMEKPDNFVKQFKAAKLTEVGMSNDELELQIDEREKARAEKNFEKADQLRDNLAKKGIRLQDTPKGAVWTVDFN